MAFPWLLIVLWLETMQFPLKETRGGALRYKSESGHEYMFRDVKFHKMYHFRSTR